MYYARGSGVASANKKRKKNDEKKHKKKGTKKENMEWHVVQRDRVEKRIPAVS